MWGQTSNPMIENRVVYQLSQPGIPKTLSFK